MALENVMRVDNGNIIDGAMPQTYPATQVMLESGDNVEDKIGNILFIEKSVSNVAISGTWGSLFSTNVTVDISSLGLSNAPDVLSVVFSSIEAPVAFCAAGSINKNSIVASLVRGTSGTVSGKIILMLKSNG